MTSLLPVYTGAVRDARRGGGAPDGAQPQRADGAGGPACDCEAGGGEEGEDDGPRPRHLPQVRTPVVLPCFVARLGLDLERSTYTRELSCSVVA